uniref:RING-type E3 ubiquitin transferase n=1 Tax=Culex tarsalis TaxID=7177 RepID=A0A1Q3F7C9_CULTA
MEEVQVIDCPPTPGSSEVLLSNTPPSSSLLDMLDSSSSAEEVENCTGEADDGTTESGRSSPPPKCAICLGKCRQKCYTDSCRHQFCYRCLLEWSKIKAECPLCKQVFRSIIYDQKTEHIIFPPTTPPASGSAAAGAGGPPQVYHRLDFTLSQPPRFTYSATLRVQPNLQQLQRLQQLFLHQSGDVQRFSREFPDDTIPSRQNGPEWRRYIYHRKLHARPLADVNGRLRECSASFYRENPAQIHRLMPWINRELIALCRGNPSQVTLILEDFPNLLMSHDITSPAFRERVSYWGRARTIHFVHELLNFARSPYDMIGYDRCVQYDPYYNNNNVVVLSSSSSSSSGSGLSGSEGEDDVVRVVEPIPGTSGMANALGEAGGRRGRTQFTIETRSSDQTTVIMTGSFGGAGVSGIVSVSTSGTQTGGPVAGASSSASFADLTRMHPLTSLAPQTSRLEDGENISLSSDDSDDCRIVGALKPPHLRTPEMVSLESESDSDVVFVNEANDTTEDSRPVDNAAILEQFLNATAVTDGVLDQNGIAKLESGAAGSEYNNGASTSSGSGGGCMKKYYAKPKLNRFVNGIGFKSIYEASESEKSKEASVHSESDSSSHDEVKFNIRGLPATINATRKRKTTKRRSRASSTGSSDDLSDNQSSTSDSESSNSSSLSSSMSSSSDDDSDEDFQTTKLPKKILKKRSSRSNKLSSSRKSSKRRSKSMKKRSKVKTRKHSSAKRNRKRSKIAKSSSESGKGTSVSATSVPSVEAVPSGSNSNTSPSCSKKRKLRSAIVRPTSTPTMRRSSFKKRRKAPICSELITSTDSSDENLPEQKQMPPAGPPSQEAAVPSSASISENNSSDSEAQCTIASLIRAAVQQTVADPEKQNTSTSSGHSATATPNTSSSSPLCSSERQQLPAREGEAFPEEEDDVSVSQAIAVGAEVEL